MNYFNLTHILLSTILLLAGNNVEAEAVIESQLRGGSDERKLQDNNRLVGEYVLDMVNTRNTEPYYPKWDYSGDDFIAYSNESAPSNNAVGDVGSYFHYTSISRTNPNSNCQTCDFNFEMILDARAVGGTVSITARIQWNRNTGRATITNVRTNNTNNIGVRTTAAIMSALRTTEEIRGGDFPSFLGDMRNQNQVGGNYGSQLFFSTEGTDDNFIAYVVDGNVVGN
ncbi:hypothetical protein FRACYDRAFT_250213 [Fragilariopsis cylindrus CCMP1102]|uniref:Uncharacterized protein n=1 Tax=Fragilariopsis cylindrus CCMP1102 TaxID=635003 RepID=A0A1E7ER16_9STRA|nr:hypothetical protein FRACYDRAFT_250213 [Fragilariopsis cylindrus CCMP1102]|eukprot:OEU07993.1 hypothetical protein FRACYDRAFT_250213 [Fragilariopsis cylindrus CCMP1102]